MLGILGVYVRENRDSSGGTVIFGRGREFFLLHHDQTGSGAQAASYPVGTRDKAAGA